MKSINVVAGIFIEDGRVFAARRAPGRTMAGKWEFVGGKIEPEESPENALMREIREELAVDCIVLGHFRTDTTIVGDLQITLRCYVASFQSPPAVSSDHDELQWFDQKKLWDVDWADADVPAVRSLHTGDPLDLRFIWSRSKEEPRGSSR